jgi:hypothetical protein
MNWDLDQATRKILTTEGDGKLILGDNNPDFLFVHSLVNYAKAKQQSARIMSALGARRRDERKPDLKGVFHALLKKYLPRIEPAEADILFETIVKDSRDIDTDR